MLAQSINRTDELKKVMSSCYGTENYYINNYLHFKYTDGVRTFCEKAAGYWILNIIEGVLIQFKQMREDLIRIVLTVREDNTATITFTDSEDDFYKQKIPFTDCPVGEWGFYFEHDVFFWEGEY